MQGPELSKGTTIANRYILKQWKGSGSFGEVWLAEDKELGIDVAVKLYISLDQKGQDEFKNEYKVAYGLSHENLLTAQYYSVWDHRPFLIMKYCSRGSAANLLGSISDGQLWNFIHDVANGLKYLHAQEPPIIHQDIKPENVLVDEHGNFLITDFGISKKMRTTMRKQSKRSIESGAIAYMGPERFLSNPMAVKASDIWSLGVSIYELATGELPFMGQGGGMLNAGAALPELDSEQWSSNLNEVLQLCLAKDTWERPTAEDLADYTGQIIQKGKNISFSDWKNDVDTDNPVPPNPIKKWIAISAIALAVVAIVVGYILIVPGKDEKLEIKQRYASLKSMCENDVKIGSPENYISLLEAKDLVDSLHYYTENYSYISRLSNSSYETLESNLKTKIAEAQAAWIRSAKGQYEIAEDIPTAIAYYHIAAQLDDNADVKSAISKIAKSTGCKGAFMNVTQAAIKDDVLTIEYNGLNASDIEVHIDYAITNPSSKADIDGYVITAIQSGKGRRLSIRLNASCPSGGTLSLSNNGVVFFRGKTD